MGSNNFGPSISVGRVLSAERGLFGGKNIFLQPVSLKMKLLSLKIKPISLNLWHVSLMVWYFTAEDKEIGDCTKRDFCSDQNGLFFMHVVTAKLSLITRTPHAATRISRAIWSVLQSIKRGCNYFRRQNPSLLSAFAFARWRRRT